MPHGVLSFSGAIQIASPLLHFKRVIRRNSGAWSVHPPDPGLFCDKSFSIDALSGHGRISRHLAVSFASRRFVIAANGPIPESEEGWKDCKHGITSVHADEYHEHKGVHVHNASDSSPPQQARHKRNNTESFYSVHGDGHGHEHDHDKSQNHGHTHDHGNLQTDRLNGLQELIRKTSVVLGLAKLANLWRNNLQVCCLSFGLLLVGAIVPFVLPNALGSKIQTALIISALPLTVVPAVLDAAIDVAGGKINIHVLMAAAAFASVFMGNILEGGLLLAMFSLSHLAEEYFTAQAMGDVKALKERNPESALVLEPFDVLSPPPLQTLPYKQLPVTEVEVGSYVLVKAGEAVPVDGEVWNGRALVTVEHLTGESHPIEKQAGDAVPGGATSLDGVIIVKATKRWQDSTIARIMKLTEEAQLNRPTLQRWLDEFGEKYSQAVVAMSLAVALMGPVFFKWPFFSSPGVRGSIYRALGLMVAASPCALAVAPLAYATAISACANKGILLKGGEALDALASCDIVAFDKTGTLTTGDLICKAIEPLRGHHSETWTSPSYVACCSPNCETEALAIAAAMERGATHPIARAVVEHSEGKLLPVVAVDNFQSVPGEGLAASVTNLESGQHAPHKALLGSLEYIASSSDSSVESTKIREAARASAHGHELIQAALSLQNKVTLFHFEDKLRPGAANVVQALKGHAKLRCLMLTGDHAASAERVAHSVGIDEIYSGLKPEDKLYQVKKLSRQQGKSSSSRGLIMVGDGINDAPALAAATVGIVLAKNASATAVSVADVLLLQDSIDGVSFVIAKAHQTTSLVKQSVALALSCIFLASLPSVLGYLPLWLTVLLHEGGTLIVCANSVRALNDPAFSWEWRETILRSVTKISLILKAWSRNGDKQPAFQTTSVSAA